MDVVTVQSRVAWGYVGNSVAVPVMQALGVHAWPVDTVRLSHHPGHGPPTGGRTPADEFTALLDSVLVKASPQAPMLLGYMGGVDQGKTVLARLSGRPLFLNLAFGDTAEGIYVSPEIVKYVAEEAVPQATVIIANRFEATELTGHDITDIDGARFAAKTLLAAGAQDVMITSVPVSESEIGSLLACEKGTWLTAGRRFELAAKGTGDLFSAAYTACRTQGEEPPAALGKAAAVVGHAVEMASTRGLMELDVPDLIAALGRGLAPREPLVV